MYVCMYVCMYKRCSSESSIFVGCVSRGRFLHFSLFCLSRSWPCCKHWQRYTRHGSQGHGSLEHRHEHFWGRRCTAVEDGRRTTMQGAPTGKTGLRIGRGCESSTATTTSGWLGVQQVRRRRTTEFSIWRSSSPKCGNPCRRQDSRKSASHVGACTRGRHASTGKPFARHAGR